MKRHLREAIPSVLLATVLAGTGLASAAQNEKDIVTTAASNDQFSTLVAAVSAGGLAPTLSGEGPFTVFAPTNEAFSKLPPGTVESLLKPENRGMLVEILKYHVVPGRLKSLGRGEVPRCGDRWWPDGSVQCIQEGWRQGRQRRHHQY